MKSASEIHAEIVRRIEQIVTQPSLIVADSGELDMALFELFRLRAFVEGRDAEFCEAWSPCLELLTAKDSWNVEVATAMICHWQRVGRGMGWEIGTPPWVDAPSRFSDLPPEWKGWVESLPEEPVQ